jgi:hypothetical protein
MPASLLTQLWANSSTEPDKMSTLPPSHTSKAHSLGCCLFPRARQSEIHPDFQTSNSPTSRSSRKRLKLSMASFTHVLFGLCLLSLRLFVAARSPTDDEASEEVSRELEESTGKYVKRFSWGDPALMEALGITKQEEERPVYYAEMNSTTEKRADDGTLIEAVAPNQCAICPNSPEVVSRDCRTPSSHSNCF